MEMADAKEMAQNAKRIAQPKNAPPSANKR
jgi:hypothetical protein